MKYDKFLTKLRQVTAEFKKINKRDPTLEELAAFVEARVIKPRTKGLRSLGGLFIGLLILFSKYDMQAYASDMSMSYIDSI